MILTDEDIKAIGEIYDYARQTAYEDEDGDEVVEVTLEFFDQIFLTLMDMHNALKEHV